MDSDILISIIVPAYNVAPWLARCLDSSRPAAERRFAIASMSSVKPLICSTKAKLSAPFHAAPIVFACCISFVLISL